MWVDGKWHPDMETARFLCVVREKMAKKLSEQDSFRWENWRKTSHVWWKFVCNIKTTEIWYSISSATNHGSSFNSLDPFSGMPSHQACSAYAIHKVQHTMKKLMVDGLSRFLCVFSVLSGSHIFVVLDQSNAIYHFQDYSRYMTINDFSRFSSLISHFFSPTTSLLRFLLTHCLIHVSCMLSTSHKEERKHSHKISYWGSWKICLLISWRMAIVVSWFWAILTGKFQSIASHSVHFNENKFSRVRGATTITPPPSKTIYAMPTKKRKKRR